MGNSDDRACCCAGKPKSGQQILLISSVFADGNAGSRKPQFTTLTVIQFIDLAKNFLVRCCKLVSTADT